MPFEIENRESGVVVVSVTGSMTLGAELPVLEARLADVSQGPDPKLVLDLAGVDFMDSSGLGVVVTCFGLINEAGGQCRVAGAGEQVRRLFRITEVDTLFVLDESLEESLRALGD